MNHKVTNVALVIFSIISCVSAQGCGSQTFDFEPDLVKVSAADFTQLQLKFGLGEKKGVTVYGGAGLNAVRSSASNSSVVVEIKSFGDLNPPGQSSDGCQPRSSLLFSYFFLLLASLGFMGMRRVEGWVLVVVCLSLFSYEVTSACSVMVVVNGYESLEFEGDVTGKITVMCEAGGAGSKAFSGGITTVSCPYGAKFAKAYSSPSNDASCAALAPASVTVWADASVGKEGLRINNIPALSVYNYTLRESIFNGPLNGPSLFPNTQVIASGPMFDMIIDGVDLSKGDGSGIFPVMLKQGTTMCKFGYKCSGGSCLEFMESYSNMCVEYGYEAPSSECVARGNGTGVSCGQNCTQFSCVALCPDFDCSKLRSCELTDRGVPYCHECQCGVPPNCYPNANEGQSVAPGLWALFVLGVAASIGAS